ncbi:MAG: copper resistance CopC family protein [Mycolicibacterium sp.]|uniref:copper resistance CopC family protein n=1 Tax=Mycolicibacterium sp. TaxID=2320850 RepID=UPI003D0B52A9
MRPPVSARSLLLVWSVFAVVAVAFFCGALGNAWAHAVRVASDPGEDAVLTEQPPRVSATFSEPMRAQFAAMTVIGPDGNGWSDGEAVVAGAVVSVGVRPGGPGGDYTVNYRATSADGHVVTGSWTYRLITAGAESETRATSTASPPANSRAPDPNLDAGRTPVWPFVAAVSGILAAGAILAVRRRR